MKQLASNFKVIRLMFAILDASKYASILRARANTVRCWKRARCNLIIVRQRSPVCSPTAQCGRGIINPSRVKTGLVFVRHRNARSAAALITGNGRVKLEFDLAVRERDEGETFAFRFES